MNNRVVELNRIRDPKLEEYLHSPKAQVKEMIRQINDARYYMGLFSWKDLVFLDLGANLGLVSLFAFPACKRVVAVEAEPRTFSMLTKILAPYPMCEPRLAALSPVTGMASLSVDPVDWSCHTLTNPKPGNPSVHVRGYTFGDLLKETSLNHVDVCKVDVEGAEMDTITLDVLKTAPVRTWYIEVHKTPTRTRDQNFVEMLERLKKAGYAVTTPRPNAIVAHQNAP